MFLRLFGLKVTESYWDEEKAKDLVNYGFTIEINSEKVSYSMDNFSFKGRTQDEINNLVIPTLLKPLQFTISDAKGDPGDSTVSEGQESTLVSFHVDQHSILRLEFILESKNETYTVAVPLSVVSGQENSIKAGNKYYLNLRSIS